MRPAERALGACNRGGQWWIQPIETGHERRRPSKPILSEVPFSWKWRPERPGSIRSRRFSRRVVPGRKGSLVPVHDPDLSSLNPGMPRLPRISKPARSKLIDTALDLLAEVVDPETGRLAAPRAIKTPRRTSADKRKSLTATEFNAVDAALLGLRHRYAFLARPYLSYTSLLGLRPSEWPTAQIIGTSLVVQNGKNSNGRANGSTRTIELDAYSEGYIQGLGEFIAALARATADGDWRRVHAGIRRALRAACIATGIPGLIRRPCHSLHLSARRGGTPEGC